jgi:hypothetical protein
LSTGYSATSVAQRTISGTGLVRDLPITGFSESRVLLDVAHNTAASPDSASLIRRRLIFKALVDGLISKRLLVVEVHNLDHLPDYLSFLLLVFLLGLLFLGGTHRSISLEIVACRLWRGGLLHLALL